MIDPADHHDVDVPAVLLPLLRLRLRLLLRVTDHMPFPGSRSVAFSSRQVAK
jgi:hypothetical protein